MPLPPRTIRHIVLATNIAALIFLVIFCINFINRALNFDESLALKSGWLAIQEIPSEPRFIMPFTLLLGLIGTAVDDPATVFLLCRIASIALALGGIALLARFIHNETKRNFTLLLIALLFSNATFIIHGFEFRYDTAILSLLLIIFCSGYRLTRKTSWITGACIALLQMHHLKGVFFSGGIIISILLLNLDSREKPRLILNLILAWSLTWTAWILVLKQNGALTEFLYMYFDFFNLANSGEKLASPGILLLAMEKDYAWWFCAIFAAACTIVFMRSRLATAATFYIIINIAFWYTHPHPWPYMLALAVPFFAILTIELIHHHPRLSAAIAATAIICQTIYPPSQNIVRAHSRIAHTTNNDQVETLRHLKKYAQKEDKIIDPSGLAYFIPPINSQWYSDTLFAREAQNGKWMRSTSIESIKNTRWLIVSYRLKYMPHYSSIVGKNIFKPLCGGLSQNINHTPQAKRENCFSWGRITNFR